MEAAGEQFDEVAPVERFQFTAEAEPVATARR